METTQQSTRILAIETSCDETAAAVVADGVTILSNVVASQTELHARYGGVFPEVASRRHVEVIHAVVEEAMRAAHLGFDDLDCVAVTRGPGLVGSLLATQLVKGLLYGVVPHDPVTLASVVVLMVGIGTVACWIPALRAARVDPGIAIRSQ